MDHNLQEYGERENTEAGHLRAKAERMRAMADNDTLRLRLHFLHGRDRALAALYLEYGASYRQISQIAGVHEVTVSRRLRRIIGRLQRWGRVRVSRGGVMGREEERIAREYLVRGRSQREVAARLGCTRYAVQKVVRAVKAATGQKWPGRNRGE